MPKSGNPGLNTETLIADLGGCGRFQITLTIYLQLAALALVWTNHTNTYGIYNPGWTCLDDVNTTNSLHNGMNTTGYTQTVYIDITTPISSISGHSGGGKHQGNPSNNSDVSSHNQSTITNTIKPSKASNVKHTGGGSHQGNHSNNSNVSVQKRSVINSPIDPTSASKSSEGGHSGGGKHDSKSTDKPKSSNGGHSGGGKQGSKPTNKPKSSGTKRTRRGKEDRDRCDAYAKCKNVQFDPTTSTLITEFHMICDRKWMRSTMLMITNAGGLFSNIVVGYFGDRFGRKYPGLFARVLSAAILNFISIYSTSWAMYVAIHFFIGFLDPFEKLWDLLAFELVPSAWRARLNTLGIPVVFAIIHSVAAMYLKDWRTLLLIASIIAAVTQIPGFWLPESIRWLIATGRKEDARKIIERMAKANKKEMPKIDYVDILTKRNEERTKTLNVKNYTYLDLFRKGYRMKTVIVGIINLSIEMVNNTLHFIVVTLPGNVYEHLIFSSLVSLPSHLFALFIANKFPRKHIYITMLTLTTCCLVALIVVNKTATGDVYVYTNLTLVLAARFFNHIKGSILKTSVVEMYPTVVRSNIHTYYYLMASGGKLIAPFLIPSGRDSFLTTFIIMSVVAGCVTAMSFLLPETKDVPMLDTFPDDDDNVDDKKDEEEESRQNGVV